MTSRRPTREEVRLLCVLAEMAGISEPGAWAEGLWVEGMNDGGMGSLELVMPPTVVQRGVIRRMSSVQFTDDDGIEVIVSLNADADGVPIEMDVWKTNYGPIIRVSGEFRRIDD